MEVIYEFKNPDWTLVWAQPGEMDSVFRRDREEDAEGSATATGPSITGTRTASSLWVGDGQVFTETKAVDFRKPDGGVTFPRARASIITRIGSRAFAPEGRPS